MNAVPKPNVVLIVVDEWRAQSFRYAGDENANTPNIDALSRESLNFDQAISGTPVCCPARASFLTGQYPLTHGVYINDVELKPTGTTLAESFAAAGYDTAYIGKWHLHGSPLGWFERREENVPPERRLGFQYWKAGECTHDYNHSFYYEGDDPAKKYWDGYDAIAQTDDACDYLHTHTTSPFFLMLSYGPPHFPLDSAPPEYREAMETEEISLRPNVPSRDAESATEDLRGYYAHASAVDDCIGRILDCLEANGLADDTIVVFTSDHGDMMWSQGLEYKLTPWEESVRVPLMVRLPGDLTERHTDALANSADLMPTLLGMAGLQIPEGVEGLDLIDAHVEAPATAFLSVPAAFSTLRWYGLSEYRGVRDTRYTYVRTLDGPWLLYDRATDPFQMQNRVDDPALASVQDYLERQLKSWLSRLDDEFLSGEQYLTRDDLTHYFEVNEPVGYCHSPWGDWRSTDHRGRRWSIDTPIDVILQDPPASRILYEECRVLCSSPEFDDLRSDSLRVAQMLRPDLLPTDELTSASSRLDQLGDRVRRTVDAVAQGRGTTKGTRLPRAELRV